MLVDFQGSGDIDMKKIKAYNAEISLMGSGDFEADDVDLATLNASVQGAGNMDLKGRVESVIYSVLGSGVINAAQLKAKRVKGLSTARARSSVMPTNCLKVRSRTAAVWKLAANRASKCHPADKAPCAVCRPCPLLHKLMGQT